jgi:CIC family chloride channel protein
VAPFGQRFGTGPGGTSSPRGFLNGLWGNLGRSLRDRARWLWLPLLRPKTLALIEACTIGLVAGLAAFFLKWGSAVVGTWRVQMASGSWPPWLVLPVVGLAGCAIAGWLVQRFAPEAAGSGIPQVKAALGGRPMVAALGLAITKMLATVLTLGSGLTLGRQGPTVQVGAALAAQLSYWIPTSPDYRRQAIAAGAGAGLAAGFNAPIAGVLFVIEELLQDVSGLTMGPAILASFVGAVVARILGGEALPVNLNVGRAVTAFDPAEIPAYLLLGLMAGYLGAWFNRGVLASLRFGQRLPGLLGRSLPLRMGLAGLVTGGIMALLPSGYWNYSWMREALVGDNIGDWPIKLATFGLYFLLTLLAFGSGAPGGLFAPSLMLGASLGSLVAVLGDRLVGGVEPATYAVVGMGAFFGAVSRVPITAIAIVFEMTADFNVVLPLMMAVVVSYLVAESVDPGSLYGRLLALRGIDPTEGSRPADRLAALQAQDAMHSPVETLDATLTATEVLDTFQRSHHRGFPVMRGGELVGILTQTDLTEATNGGLDPDALITELMTPHPMAVQVDDSLADVRYLFSRYRLSRLPVLEGRRLVGIVTRSDLLRLESQSLGDEPRRDRPRAVHPSYGVYRVRAPKTGRGLLLVPLANPHTAGAMLRLALAIARERQYAIECLHVVPVPNGLPPSEAVVDFNQFRPWLDDAVAIGRRWQVPVHVQARTTHNISQAILETIHGSHANGILLGWQGEQAPADRAFGAVTDDLIGQAPCDVLLVKWSQEVFAAIARRPHAPLRDLYPQLRLDRWLVPVSGGPNIQRALQLMPGLAKLGQTPEVILCQVHTPDAGPVETQTMDRAWRRLSRRVPTRAVCSQGSQVADTILALADEHFCDAIAIGASRDSLLQRALHGNLPKIVARRHGGTTLIVRAAR